MADTIKSDYSLHINWQFSDGDTRILELKDPKNITESYTLESLRADLKNYRDWTAANQILVSDRDSDASFADSDTAIKYAYIHMATDRYLDLS